MARGRKGATFPMIMAVTELLVMNADKVARAIKVLATTIRRRPKASSESENQHVVDAVVARRFILRDSKNQIRAELSLVDDAPTLQLCDGSGQPRIVLHVDAGQDASVAMFDRAGQLRISMTCSSEEGPGVALHDAQGEGLVAMGVFDHDGKHGAAGTCAMMVRNARSDSGCLIVAGDSADIAVTAAEEPAETLQLGPDCLAISDKRGMQRIVLGLGDHASPELP